MPIPLSDKSEDGWWLPSWLPSSWREGTEVVLLVLIWYASSSLSNTMTKVLLNADQDPTFVTILHFFFVAFFSRLSIASRRGSGDNAVRRFFAAPDPALLRATLPVSLAGMVGHWLSAVSLSYVPVSFTHTIKSTGPIFSVVLSKLMLREETSVEVVLSLLPIVFGVGLSTSSELNGNVPGFLCAIVSTVVFVFQNVYSKKLFSGMDDTQLLFSTSFTSFSALLPLWLTYRVLVGGGGSGGGGEAAAATGGDGQLTSVVLLSLFFCGGLSYWVQNLAAVMTLKRMSPVTYSVCNTLKRVAVILFSIFYFANPISMRNGVGMSLALAGVALYNNARIRLKAAVQQRDRHELPYSASSAMIV